VIITSSPSTTITSRTPPTVVGAPSVYVSPTIAVIPTLIGRLVAPKAFVPSICRMIMAVTIDSLFDILVVLVENVCFI
jgi:hypothetical protein